MKTAAPRQASTLAASLVVLAILAGTIAAYYQSLIPQARTSYDAASWNEALHGAEAGVDYAIRTLNGYAASMTAPDSYTWTGWTADSNGTNGTKTLNTSLSLGGTGNVTVTELAVDVYTRDTTQAEPPPWFRVRSKARADLVGKTATLDPRDAVLQRLSLSAKSAGTADPHVFRRIDAVLKPKYRFPRAITTALDLSLGNSANWLVDSFDSSDAAKSDAGPTGALPGIYPSHASERQTNGGVASMKAEPSGVLYGPLISGNGAVVKGDVQTNGGDDPATNAHENVSGSGGMDQSRIFDQFDEDIPAVPKPTWASFLPAPVGNTGFLTGTASNPNRYVVSGRLAAFAVTAPASGTGYVEILVNGTLDIGNGNKAYITIPPNVYATIYVDGNIDLGNGDVNSDSDSSQVASHLAVVGVAATGTYTASGNGTEILTLYAPNYAVTLNGTVTTIGAMVAKSFSISGGGNGGFHYDEALGKSGTIASWVVAGYFDDSRLDPEQPAD